MKLINKYKKNNNYCAFYRLTLQNKYSYCVKFRVYGRGYSINYFCNLKMAHMYYVLCVESIGGLN